MDTASAQWPPQPQAKQMVRCPKERKMRAEKEEAVKCPRCSSSNTKFCYYNNYSLSQPRYLCKTCRRYWTQGGSLRNIPVGGGSRKNKPKLPDFNPKKIPTSSPLELLTAAPGGLSSFMPPADPYSSSLNFSVDGVGSFQEANGKLLFPFEDLKLQVENNAHDDQNSSGFWNGVIGGGSW